MYIARNSSVGRLSNLFTFTAARRVSFEIPIT